MIRIESPAPAKEEVIVQKWLDKGALIEKGGLHQWETSLSHADMPHTVRSSLFKSVAQRFATLDSMGLAPDPTVICSIVDFLRNPQAKLSPFPSDRPVLAVFQPRHLIADRPNIKGEKLMPAEVTALARHLAAEYPAEEFMITMIPFFQITHHANVMVNSDRSLRIEGAARGSSPTRNGRLDFCAETPRFQSWPLKSDSEDPTHIDIMKKIMAALPKRECVDGHGEEFLPGYYEVAIGHRPDASTLHVIFNDYREGRHFTL
jgi:hypothetical protein